MATPNAKLAPPPPTNGVITAPAIVGGNRKKQKRRAKQAAKAAAQVPAPITASAAGQPADVEYDEDPLGYGDEDYDDSEAEEEQYEDQYVPAHASVNGFDPAPPGPDRKKDKQKMAGALVQQQHHHHAYDPDVYHPPTRYPPPWLPAKRGRHNAFARNSPRDLHRDLHGEGNIWNTSTAQERQNIKDFWLSLSEEERKSLLKIEKEAVLRKMKQQQKHSCSCTVCGRKRTAIEEELEVLYEGYYEELEQYAHHDHPPLPTTDGLVPDPLQHRRPPHPLAAPPPNPQHKTSQLHEHLDEEEFSDEEEYSEDEEYSDEESEAPRSGVPDFFNFGQNLTVKGILTPWLEKLQQGLKGKADNLLTVADDLLKNDGRKFIEMMEQLAERRMQRESEAEYAAANPSHPGAYPPNDPAYNHEDPLAAGDEFDDEEGSYDSQEEYEDEMEEEDEMVRQDAASRHYHVFCANNTQGGLTEEQRMQEGRRMFQIFAARMFEQRVLTAYREKVAAERQQKLLEEIQDEDKLAAQREAKKQRDAAKKKEKKKQQQAAKAEEKAKKEAEKAAEEARAREAEEKKQEEQRRKKEEQRRKKDEEKRRQDEERAKKEADRTRRLQEDQQRKDEAERKAREQKALEKAKKEEARKREREEREAREAEARERKAQEDRERRERELKVRAETEAKDREKAAQQHQQPPPITKRPSQMGMVAVPGVYPKPPSSGISSPHASIAMPAVPKAPTLAKPRQASQQGSHASSPRQSQSQTSSAPSKSSSPGSIAPQQQHPPGQPKVIMQKPNNHQPGLQHPMHTTSPLHQHSIQPPPGMPHPHQLPGGFGMPHMGYQGFQGTQGPMMHGNNIPQRGPMPMYQQQGPPMGVPNRTPFGPGLNGMPIPPPGMMPQGRGMGFPFDASGPGQPPPGFSHPPPPNHSSPIGQPPPQHTPSSEPPRTTMPTHSRQQSASDKERFESAANQPIARPAPIQRPSSVKPQNEERDDAAADVDDLSAHLGSKALLADDDEPLPTSLVDNRRPSGMQPPTRNPPPSSIGPIGGFGSPVPGFAVPSSNWNTPSLPFGQTSGLGQQNWTNLPNAGVGGWAQNHGSFSANNAFGTIGAQMHRPSAAGLSRPLTIRLAVCQACKQLTNAARGEGDGYHDVHILLKQIDGNRPLLDAAPSLREIEEICETEGDGGNGGGELHVRKSDGGGDGGFAVKWEPDAGTPDQGRGSTGLGEIGSPMPTRISPAVGFGAPGMGRGGGYQSLGAVGSPNF